MDIKAYIQSGIVEQYVLGLADAGERAELEQLRAKYPELNEAILNFEESLEKTATANAIQPPAFIRASLEKQLFPAPATIAPAENTFTPQPQFARVYNNNLWKYLAAACIILLIASTTLNFYFYSGYKNSAQQYEALLAERNTLQANNVLYKQGLQMFQDSLMLRIPMNPLPGREQNFATVLWDKNSKAVYIYTANMQQAPKGKQYQLWAIVDGKPVNVGMIDSDCNSVCELSKINHAEAFAITLEKEGGSPAPTMTEMYVLGKVKA